MIVNSTVASDGVVIQRWPISVKLAIGIAPSGTRNFPERLDHIIALRRGATKGEWVIDKELMKRIAPDCKHEDYSDSCVNCCREIKAMWLSDDPEEVFNHEMAWWKKSGKFCHGDGVKADRRNEAGNFAPYPGPCKNGGCHDYTSGECKASGDLRFMLPQLDFRIGRIHTSSLRSVENIWSGLMLAKQWAGRLAGISCPIRVTMEQSAYTDDKGNRKSTVVPILSVGVNPMQLLKDAKETGQLMQDARKAFRVLVIDEDEEERAVEIPAEFPAKSDQKALPEATTQTTDTTNATPEPAKTTTAPQEQPKQETTEKPKEEKPKDAKPPVQKTKASYEGMPKSFQQDTIQQGAAKGKPFWRVMVSLQHGDAEFLVFSKTVFEKIEDAIKRGVEVSMPCEVGVQETKSWIKVLDVDYVAKAPEPEPAKTDHVPGGDMPPWMLE